MRNSTFEPSSCDWGMGGYYREMEIRDAQDDVEEAYREEMEAHFEQYRDDIMPQIYLYAYEYRKEALLCGQDNYLADNKQWMVFLADCLSDMDFDLKGWQDEEAREALAYLIDNRGSYLHCSKIDEFATAYKGA